MKDSKEILKIIELKLIEKSWKQKDLAKELDVNVSSVAIFLRGLENGSKPHIQTIHKYANALGIPAESFF